jgi:hypothetical protein
VDARQGAARGRPQALDARELAPGRSVRCRSGRLAGRLVLEARGRPRDPDALLLAAARSRRRLEREARPAPSELIGSRTTRRRQVHGGRVRAPLRAAL